MIEYESKEAYVEAVAKHLRDIDIDGDVLGDGYIENVEQYFSNCLMEDIDTRMLTCHAEDILMFWK